MIRKLLIILLPIGLLAFTYSPMYEDGIPVHTGAPGEGYCNDCHGGGLLNSGSGSITIQSPGMANSQYTPGQTYNMSVTVSQASSNLFGVDIEALNYLNGNAGTLNITDPASTQLRDGYINSYLRHNIVHTTGGGYSPGSKVFNFSWTAPSSGTGTVTFYFSGIASDTSGYNVYASSQSYTDVTCSTPAKPNSISGSSTLCSGSSFNYSIAAVPGASSYSWSLPPGWLGTSSTTSISGIVGNISGNIFVTANNSCGGGPARTKPITVIYVWPYSVITSPSCYGDSDGSINVTPSGGTPPYSYLWWNGNTTPRDSNLAAGNYSITVTDATGCSGSTIFTVGQPIPVDASIWHADPLCNGASTGSAHVTAWGGSYYFYYNWSPTGAATSTASNLAAGIYSVTVTDSRGCSVTRSDTLSEPTALSSSTTQNNILCNGDSTGNAAISVSSGTPGYTYYWSPAGGFGYAANNLIAGLYTVRVTDANQCSITSSITITQPSPIFIAMASNDDFCNTANGVANALPAGGNGPYTYSWSTTPVQQTSTIANLGGGTYLVTVTDANGCTTTASATINQPALLVAEAGFSQGICEGNSLNLGGTPTALGGTGPYTYQWSPSTALSSATNPNPLATPLTQTYYTVLITDVNNCTASSSVGININSLPVASVTSNGDTLFSTPGYSYQWNFGNDTIDGATDYSYVPLQNGNYSVIEMDSNGCIDTSADFNFTTLGLNTIEPEFSCKVFPNPAKNFITIYCPDLFSNKTIKIVDANGDCVYRGLLENGNNTININGLACGNYYLVAGSGFNMKTKRIIISK